MSQFPKAQMTTAAPTIERTCADYLAVRSSFPCHSASADSPRADERENAIDMLRSFVHYNGHRALSPAEASSFERQLQTTSDLSDYRGFEQTFGPNKLPALIASFIEFLTYDLYHQAGQRFVRVTCLTLEDYCLWLVRHNLIDPADGEEAAYRLAELGRNLPRARRAMRRLLDEARKLELSDSDSDWPRQKYLIRHRRAGLLWLENEEGEVVGPVKVGEKNRRDLESGWEMDCSLTRVHNCWRISAVGGIHPLPR